MRIVMPMAGRGSRLGSGTQDLPKPLVPVAGRPMLRWAMESLRGVDCSLFIAVVLAEHDRGSASGMPCVSIGRIRQSKSSPSTT